jgi:hypothetical protein
MPHTMALVCLVNMTLLLPSVTSLTVAEAADPADPALLLLAAPPVMMDPLRDCPGV